MRIKNNKNLILISGERMARLGGGRQVIVIDSQSDIADCDAFRKKHGFRQKSLENDRFFWNGELIIRSVTVPFESFIAKDSEGTTFGFDANVFEYIETQVVGGDFDALEIRAINDFVSENQQRLVNEFGITLDSFI